MVMDDIKDSVTNLLAQIVADTKTDQEAALLLADILTDAEKDDITKRLAIAILLSERKSYDQIKKLLKTSSATIARVQESMDSPGMKLALSKIAIDDWAGKWANKFSGALEKLLGKPIP